MTDYKKAKRRVRQFAKDHGLTYQQAQQRLKQMMAATKAPRLPEYPRHPACPHCQRQRLDPELSVSIGGLGKGTLVLHGRWDPTPIVELSLQFADPHKMGFHVTGCNVIGESHWIDAFHELRNAKAIRILGSSEGVHGPVTDEKHLHFGSFVHYRFGIIRQLDPGKPQREFFVHEEEMTRLVGLPLVHYVRRLG